MRPGKNEDAGGTAFALFPSILVMIFSLACTGHKTTGNRTTLSTGRIEFKREFAPSEGLVKGPEAGFRKEICLNGKWDFQPVYGPYDQKKTIPYGIDADETGADLPDPVSDKWEKTMIKVPSSWNANEEFQSYPKAWSQARMGWLRKKFIIPADWDGKRIIINFQAVSGDCKVLINGERAGGNFDQSLPFGFDITDKVKKGAENEVLIGIRSRSFFDWQGTTGNLTSPPGGGRWLGIWQDVFLFALPDIYISNLFVKPGVSKNLLSLEITIKNNTSQSKSTKIGAEIREWINLTGNDSLNGPEIKWKLGEKVMEITGKEVNLPAGKETKIELTAKVDYKLKLWSFDTPNLYGSVVSLADNAQVFDIKYERFGWREFRISGKKLLLNDKEIQLLGDSQHLQGISSLTRRFAWSWYKLLKDVGANSARLHAQVYPEYFLDMADEMGICILPESSIYASSCNINYDSRLFWKAAKYNVGGMVIKYRNHPSAYGWSIENEVLPALGIKTKDPVYKKMVYDGMGELAGICRNLDPTRDWISGDGSRDMDGRLPVYNEHYGSTKTYLEESASTNKPYGVGEAGIAYYATPRQSSVYVGDRAYRSYKDHSEAIAIDTYELLKVERAVCTYCSVWNVGFYGVEVLPLGKSDLSTPPAPGEGIFLTAEYQDGKPGMQPERIPPYATQYNPGYDPHFPLYKPLQLYYAVKAAYQPVLQAYEFDHRQDFVTPAPPVIKEPVKEVLFLGQEGSDLFIRLKSIGIPLTMKSSGSKVLIVDCGSANADDTFKNSIKSTVKGGAQVIFWGLTPKNQNSFIPVLPYQIEVFDRPATSLVSKEDDNRVSSIPYKDLYFTENTDSKTIMKYGLKGAFVEKGTVLLRACPVNWANSVGGSHNNGGMMRSERENPAGPSFVEVKKGSGSYIVSTIDLEKVTIAHVRMLSQLFKNLGVEVTPVRVKRGSLLDQTATLTRSIMAGYKSGLNVEQAFKKDFVSGEKSVKPEFEMITNGSRWNVAEARSGAFRFDQQGSRDASRDGSRGNDVIYLSFWLQCPEPLNEIMTNPNVPEVGLKFTSEGGIRIWLNGQEKFSSISSQADTVINRLTMVRGWNHFLIKCVRSSDRWSFAGRLVSKNYELITSMNSAFNPFSERANFFTIRHLDPENSFDKAWGLGDGYESSTPGSIAKLKFYGTGVSLTGKVSPEGGQAKIYIDGNFDKLIDFYNKVRDTRMKYYSKSGLINGEHEITIEVVKGWVAVSSLEQWESYK
jgi:hypothetical protein